MNKKDYFLSIRLYKEYEHVWLQRQFDYSNIGKRLIVKDPDWINAQSTDCTFISDYAKEHPEREDIAESYLPYFAIKYRRDRIPESLIEKIEKAIPNRIEYFNKKTFKMYPVE